MGKKKSAAPDVGSSVQVLEGVTLPEAPQFDIGGWTGTVVETSGKGTSKKLIIQWDEAALAKATPEMKELCEANGWLVEMACLPADQVAVQGAAEG